ncbi:sensory box histidine kinase/response regulator [Legionella geestiana]|uniref:histidine kinase n=1 Tax=Legionella geestiana TaxID=45065 RepID=A0A0W0TT21_9GAMM|nr:PAS domain-containing hybrid sensor histidine kinase/response regulator [Legionella geestiana]KTC98818.1 sensory box histidine kinase/response regulator [Legionella geestiana]QBS12820.1 PAS domain-containing hybrid sensor histidine kinase/response regulator [Legionella geestiana]STX54697.1 sensory box histidine kinase/response regulator [Legionella geestiana]
MGRKKSDFYLTLDEMGAFLAKFSEQSDQVYWISSPDFKKIQYVSPSFEKIWGRPREDLYNAPEKWLTWIHAEDIKNRNPIEEMSNKIKLRGEHARYSEKYRIIRPDGEIRWIKDSGFPLINDKGVCYGVTGVAIDVTEDSLRENALKMAKEAAEAANRAKDEFIRNMSHDIRTPLSGIIGMSSILEQEVLSAEEKEHAHMINISGEQLLALLNSVLDIVATGKQTENHVELKVFKLRELIQSIADLELPTITLKKLELRLAFSDLLPEMIESDPVKIHRILLNLLGNAVKFTNSGYIEMGARWGSTEKEKNTLELYVRDTGIGIPESEQEQIFKKFFRGTASSDGIFTGHGVGLHIVKRYTRILKGDIHVSSVPGQGTTFTVFIPVKSAHAEASAGTVSAPAPSRATAAIDKKLKVLLIEDNAIALKTAEILLRQLGIDVKTASTGARALECFKAETFHIVLSDIGLPDMSGTEVARCIRCIEKDLGRAPVLLAGLTAHAHVQTREEALHAGMNELLNKPIRHAEIQELIQRYQLVKTPERGTDSHASKKTADGLPGSLQAKALSAFPLLNVEEGIRVLGSEHDLIEMLQCLIKESLADDFARLKAAREANDWEKTCRLAHKIKGGAVYVGTTRMKQACENLEKCQVTEEDVDTMEARYQEALTVIEETAAHVREWLLARATENPETN